MYFSPVFPCRPNLAFKSPIWTVQMKLTMKVHRTTEVDDESSLIVYHRILQSYRLSDRSESKNMDNLEASFEILPNEKQGEQKWQKMIQLWPLPADDKPDFAHTHLNTKNRVSISSMSRCLHPLAYFSHNEDLAWKFFWLPRDDR